MTFALWNPSFCNYCDETYSSCQCTRGISVPSTPEIDPIERTYEPDVDILKIMKDVNSRVKKKNHRR